MSLDKIFGYSWEEIQAAQQRGGTLPSKRLSDRPSPPDPITAQDKALLATYGSLEALEAAGLYGIADRLRRTGVTSTPSQT